MKTKTIATSELPTIDITSVFDGNIKRAYEIASVGGHSITLCYYKSINGDYDRDVNPNDCKIIADAFNMKSVNDGDLLIEVVRISFDELFTRRKGEPMEVINERIAMAKLRPVVTSVEKLDVCMSLFKTAYERLNLGLTDVNRVFSMASSIARLDARDSIRVEHIAEAIQYRSLVKDETTRFYVS